MLWIVSEWNLIIYFVSGFSHTQSYFSSLTWTTPELQSVNNPKCLLSDILFSVVHRSFDHLDIFKSSTCVLHCMAVNSKQHNDQWNLNISPNVSPINTAYYNGFENKSKFHVNLHAQRPIRVTDERILMI